MTYDPHHWLAGHSFTTSNIDKKLNKFFLDLNEQKRKKNPTVDHESGRLYFLNQL